MDTCNSKDMYVVPTVVGYCLSLQEETVERLVLQSLSGKCWESHSWHKLKWPSLCHEGELPTICLVFRRMLFLNLRVNVWCHNIKSRVSVIL
jgi:hypothetical protein